MVLQYCIGQCKHTHTSSALIELTAERQAEHLWDRAPHFSLPSLPLMPSLIVDPNAAHQVARHRLHSCQGDIVHY